LRGSEAQAPSLRGLPPIPGKPLIFSRAFAISRAWRHLASHVRPPSASDRKAETKKKYNHSLAPLEVAQREGKTVLKARLTGNFPGSPVSLEFSFVLEGGKIASLEIH
jgi:hypothetical protein